MKRLVEVQEVEGDGLVGLLGQYIQVWGANYIYTGKLVGVNTYDIVLEDGAVVYETGPLNEAKFTDSQKILPKELFIRTAAIEAYWKVDA